MNAAHLNPGPKSRFRSAEAARILLLAVVATWLLHPFATANQVGAGDALWYANMLADFVLQLRAGVFPVFVGQTDYAFNGAVYPLRVAPFYQHLAGVLDLLTGRQLGIFALQHLCVLVVGYAGIFSSYFALNSIAPGQRWSAAGFATLYLSCPGLLGTIYTQDLFMTWMTVPFVPLVLYGLVRAHQIDSLSAQIIIAASLAALWFAHSPVAFWLTLIVFGLQLVRITSIHRNAASWRRALAGAATFVLLAHYPFVSVATVPRPGAASVVAGGLALDGFRADTLREVFPAVLLPLSDHARSLADLQLGYGLWLALLAATAFWLRRRNLILGGLLGAAVLLLALLFPWPGNAWLWERVPEQIRRITSFWPMQRFYLILAGITSVAGQLTFASFARQPSRLTYIAGALIFVAGSWSLWESRQFVAAGRERTASAATTAQNLRPENRILMVHSYGLIDRRPAYFSDGVMDPASESRLLSLSEDFEKPTRPSTAIQEGWLTGTLDANPGILNLAPSLRLEPGLRYELHLAFSGHDYHGILQIVGRSFFREYILPSSGEALAFGSTRAASNRLSLWTTDPAGDTVTLRFIPTVPGAKSIRFAEFGRYTLSRIDPATATIALQSLVPYRAIVRSPAPARLETPRMAMPGYNATLDGNPVSISRSAEGLVTIAVPAGQHLVELSYRGPFLLRFSYWLCLAAWCALAVVATWLGLRSLRRADPI